MLPVKRKHRYALAYFLAIDRKGKNEQEKRRREIGRREKEIKRERERTREKENG